MPRVGDRPLDDDWLPVVTLGMDQRELARRVEGSEACAYASLMGLRSADLSPGNFSVTRIGSAWAMLSPVVTGTLNFNRVIGLGLEAPAQACELDAITRHYAKDDLSYAIELGPHAQPQELLAWLRERRIRRTLTTAMYYREAYPIESRVAQVEVVRADSAADSQRVAEICCKVFRMPPAVQSLLAATGDDPRWRQWLALRDSIPVAAALSFVSDQVAWLGWDATLPQHRGQGAHGALIAARVNDARAAGCLCMTTETAAHTPAVPDPSGRNYEKMGFLLAQNRVTYVAIRPRSLPPVRPK